MCVSEDQQIGEYCLLWCLPFQGCCFLHLLLTKNSSTFRETDLGMANRAHPATTLIDWSNSVWSTILIPIRIPMATFRPAKKCSQLVMSAMNAGTVPGMCYPFLTEQLSLHSLIDLILQFVFCSGLDAGPSAKFTVHDIQTLHRQPR